MRSGIEKGAVETKPWGWRMLVFWGLWSRCDRKWCRRETQRTPDTSPLHYFLSPQRNT